MSAGSSGHVSHLASGAFAGFVATSILHPLDLIKTRLHVQDHQSSTSSAAAPAVAGGSSGGSSRNGQPAAAAATAAPTRPPGEAATAVRRRLPYYRGLVDAFRTIARIEGLAGFYQGLLPNLVGNTASWSVYMYAYSRCKTAFGSELQGSRLYIASATTAGAMTTLLLHPVFTVKTRLQLQLRVAEGRRLEGSLLPAAQRDNYTGSVNAIRRMIAEEGVLSLYRGLGPSMLLVSHGSIQFLAYEQAKAAMTRYRAADSAAERAAAAALAAHGETMAAAAAAAGAGGGGGNRGGGGSGSGGGQRGAKGVASLSAPDLMVASTSSKVIATLGTYPYQVVRSCMQQRAVVAGDAAAAASAAASEVVSHLWRGEGLRGFYRGIWPHILRSTPQATLTLLLYEYAQRFLTAS